MRSASFVAGLAALSLGLSCGAVAAGEEAQLLGALNAYRAQVQSCAGEVAGELPPLSADPRLIQPAGVIGDLQAALSRSGYPMVDAQAITLSGPRDAPAAMEMLRQSFCQVVLAPQYVDVGIHHVGRDWRVVLARPLLGGKLGDWQAEGRKLLDAINAARAQARQCGSQPFAAAAPLSWSEVLGAAAQGHSRAMANGNFFAHQDRGGYTPSDRAELAGYQGRQVGENIAAALDGASRVVDGWLASPAHCANLMNPQFSELGAAYAVDPKSAAGIYWTALFGAP